MSLSHTYTVDLNWQRDRQGELTSSEFNQKVSVATPPPFEKGITGLWSPEHLFTAAVSSCLMTTFLAIAENSRLEFENFTCKATGTLGQVDGKYQMTEIALYPRVVIRNSQDAEKALRIIQKAEAACLITRSIQSKVLLRPEVIVRELNEV